MDVGLLIPEGWNDYELVDCGGFEKLERFGRYLVARPEPQAVWDKSLGDKEWAPPGGRLFPAGSARWRSGR